MKYGQIIASKSLFVCEVNVSPLLINCLSLDKLLTFPSLVLNMAGFNLSCSDRPHKIFHLMS